MSSTLVDLADAVVVELNEDQRFSQPLSARRSYLPVYELKELASLKVDVVPPAFTTARVDRRAWQRGYRIEVLFQQVLATASLELLDPLMALVEEVAEWFRSQDAGKPLRDRPKSILLAVDNDPAFVPDWLDEEARFSSLLTLTFQEIR